MALDLYSKSTTDTLLAAKLDDAPSDGSTYGRKDGAWSAVGGGSKTVNNQFGPYTLVAGDAENIVNATASSSTAIVVPQDSTYDFPIGTTIILVTNDPYNGIQSEYTGFPGYPYVNNGYGGQFNGLLVTLVKIGANNWIYG
jgi:hypothetical protein